MVEGKAVKPGQKCHIHEEGWVVKSCRKIAPGAVGRNVCYCASFVLGGVYPLPGGLCLHISRRAPPPLLSRIKELDLGWPS